MTVFYILIYAVLIIIPFWKILPRHGIHQYWSLLAVLPALALILLYIIAFKEEDT